MVNEKLYEEYETFMKQRPHVVLLGAGASVAAIPNGDKNGKKTSVMKGFLEKLGMQDTINDLSLKTNSDNLEDIYSELAASEEYKEVCKELEKRIYDYFASFEIPDEPTVYDYLILSLTKKDLIATFNWDPLLLQAYKRVGKITNNLPHLAFLHGNVMVGVCEKDNLIGLVDSKCPKCKNKFTPMPLLYPVSEKNYEENKLIAAHWKLIRQYLKKAYMFTIFGYSAPSSDKSAIDLLKLGWGKNEERNMEEIEIIDIQEEEILKATWNEFVHTHHCSVNNSIYASSLGKYPRRSCEATFDRLMNCEWLDSEKGFKEGMSFNDIQQVLNPLFEEETQAPKMLSHPYVIQ
ncbi:hypothetical protein ORL62_21605 [Bacillus cereus]|uniref:hypothetical protein n=1 Tax=Bacillus cereus TaxID=1396 RepID=UPI002AC1D3F3|nr:hypothetical protein [Bacillus cereus]MDZ4410499.1 hypothetical protein [Bacillus cereus]